MALWVCTEDRLGRVGTLKYFAWLIVALTLAMALSTNVTPLFLTLAMANYFCSCEGGVFCRAVLCQDK